jgi:glycosyltransferase involved in cell wall biosynthesis
MVRRAPLEQRKPRLISVGSLTYKKNFSTVLRAIVEIKDQIESYTIIGEGPERARLEHLIWEYALQEIVTLPGWSDSIDKHLEVSDIQVIPSLWEGFGLVAVEGMSTGISIVASNVDGLREVLGQSNPAVTFVYDIQNVRDWSEGLKNAIEKLRIGSSGELALASREQAQKFTLDAMAERYLAIYNSL